jgi:RNA polymerase sigma factor (sigma-70 family)
MKTDRLKKTWKYFPPRPSKEYELGKWLGVRLMGIRPSAIAMEGIQALFSCGVMGSWSDGQLVAQFLSTREEGGDAAFRVLLHRHGPMVLGICRRVLGDEHAAEDAFQATFLLLVKKAGTLRDCNRLSHWLYGVALRVANDEKVKIARRRIVERRAGEQTHAAEPTGREAGDLEQTELGSVIDEEIRRLPERYRVPLVLCLLEGLRHDEVAHHLGCPLGTIESRLSRAREKLQHRLTRRGLAPMALAFEPLRAWPVVPTLVEATLRAAVAVSPRRVGVGIASAWSIAGRVLEIVSKLPVGTILSTLVICAGIGAMGLRVSRVGSEPRAVVEPQTAMAVVKTASPPDRASEHLAPIPRLVPEPSRAEVESPRATRSPAALATALTGITIDGLLDDWPKNLAHYPIRNPFLGAPAYDKTARDTNHDPAAYFMVGYDRKNELIYLAVVVRDEDLVILRDGLRTVDSAQYGTDAVEVFVDGRHSQRRISDSVLSSRDWRDVFDARTMPALQYVAVPGQVPTYADQSGANLSLAYGRIELTQTMMTYRRDGNVTTYEWAIQAFDRYPDQPTRLQPGKRLGFDVAVVDKDRSGPPAYLTWGSPPRAYKASDAGKLGEVILADEPEVPDPARKSSHGP